MSAMQQIIRWAQELPAWQADAVRRFLQHGELTAQDREEIYQMLKVHAGIEENCVDPAFPQLAGFSGAKPTQQSVTLQRISDVQHVNAIENGSTIPFGHKGITVIYGENGSGKSGYARILKRACRARDIKEPIHPNVFDKDESGPAAAIIKIAEGETENIPLPWTDGETADERLSAITYFDSKCARVIVDENNEAVYVPYGCHVFDDLVRLIKNFKDRLATERPAHQELSMTNVVTGTTSHTFLLQLSRNTKQHEIAAATTWTPTDEEKLANLLVRIAQSRTNEALENARRRNSTSARAGELATAIKHSNKSLSAEIVTKLNTQRQAIVTAEAARKLAADSDLRNEPLPIGNTDEWRFMYNAARDFSINVAYPGLAFPEMGSDALCVLCQQTLDDEGKLRFERFKKFMEDKSEQALSSARQQLNDSLDDLRELKVPRAEDYKNVLDELPLNIKNDLEQHLLFLGNERDRLVQEGVENRMFIPIRVNDGAGNDDEGPTAELVDFELELTALRNSQAAAAAQAKKDADPESLKQLEILRDGLASRKSLHGVRGDITSFVERKKLEYKYEQCTSGLTTRSISDRSKEIISAALSPQLEGDLKQELSNLGADHLPLNVQITGREGGARHQITLKSEKREKLSEILSEGEHRVVAIAGFLAELGGAPSRSPIVLDDPVSSLDHVVHALYCETLRRGSDTTTGYRIYPRHLVSFGDKKSMC